MTLALHSTFDASDCRFTPSLADQAHIAQLDKPLQDTLDLWLRVMGRCHVARNRKATYAALEAELKPSQLKGFSKANIKRVFLAFKASNWDWRTLVAHYHLPVADAPRGNLPVEFVSWWQRFAGTYSEGTRAAWTELQRKWKANEEIPGFGTWMSWWQERNRGHRLPAIAPDLPSGCSYENLLAKVPKGAEITVVREGYFAAAAELPIMRRDRTDLRLLELTAFDDKQLDFRVAVPGLSQVCKLLGLFAMDVSTATIAEHGAGARAENEEGIQQSLTRASGRALLFQFLRRYGIPRHYKMHLLFENASFAIDEHDADFLRRLTGGRIVVDRTPMRSGRLLAGGPTETFGAPQAKGWLESYFNLLDGAVSALPGQAGRNPLTAKKGDIDSVEKEALQLLKISRDLPAAIQQLVQLPILTDKQGKVVLAEIVARLDHRNHHRLQGFEPIPKWRLRGLEDNNPWRAVTELPAGMPDSAIEIEHFMESPAEKFRRLYLPADFEPIGESALTPLLDDKRTVSVERPYQVSFQYQKVTRTFTLEDPRLEKIGEHFTAVYDRTDLDRIHLFTVEGGAYIGTALLWRGPNPVDREQIKVAAETIKRQQRHIIKRAVELHQPRAQEQLDAIANSNAAIEGEVARMESARLAGGHMAAATEAHKSVKAASKTRSIKRRDAADAALSRATQAGAEMTGL